MIRRLIEQIKKNLKKLQQAYENVNADSALAIVTKLGNLMCMFEHIFVLLGAVAGIFELIQSAFRPIRFCNDGSGSGTDDDSGMCTDFLGDPEIQLREDLELWQTRMKGPEGKLLYTNTVIGSPYPMLAGFVGIVRTEKLYLCDDVITDSTLYLSNIIESKPTGSPIRKYPFFPPNTTISSETPEDSIPYMVNLNLTCDPHDGYGLRNIAINDVIVNYPTYTIPADVVLGSVYPYTNTRGYLAVSDGYTIDSAGQYNNHDILTLVKAAINDPTKTDPNDTGTGTHTDLLNVEYQVAVNYESLAVHQLISMSCIPGIALEDQILEQSASAFFNEELPIDFPDVDGAMTAMTNCITSLRSNMSLENTDNFDTCMNTALNDLNAQAQTTLCQAITALIDPHLSTVVVSPDMQFPGQAINIEVTLNLSNGQSLMDMVSTESLSAECLDSLADKLSSTVTLGSSGKFTYDGYGLFISEIISDNIGDGEAIVSFDGIVISPVVRPDDLDQPSYIDEGKLPYSFVGFQSVEGDGNGEVAKPRRDEADRAGV